MYACVIPTYMYVCVCVCYPRPDRVCAAAGRRVLLLGGVKHSGCCNLGLQSGMIQCC